MTAPLLLRGVDRAALAVALVARLRAAGVVVSASGPGCFVAALGALTPMTRRDLYWIARLTLVNRAEDIAAFDAVFDAVFTGVALGMDPASRKATAGGAVGSVPDAAPGEGAALDGAGLPWVTPPRSVSAADAADAPVTLPDVLPSRLALRADEPFENFDEDDLRLIGGWLEQSVARWPRRRTLRRERCDHGPRIDLRATMRASRTTGWETLRLTRTRPRPRPRRIVLLCDVSRSMQPYVAIYLHLMRAVMLRPRAIRPEVFAFATSLTRLTPVLAHRSAEVALSRANAKVSDRYGGTRLGASLADLVGGPHGNVLRGAVVVIASDGWDADPPENLDRAMARLRRRAALVAWLNPRAAAPDFRPLAGSMAAALPYCDVFLPAHSLSGVREMLERLQNLAPQG
ncbi:VWA domain-containing protein [Mycobacterium sp. Y57]|uniref:vWA domain-containing protein n=1 Tax=Mycolicibacterium xanthum TaxID=2796469 RepID=UPI001C846F6D|nr:VWA domain-containing protein [Mycolicibacterium xanthum]MBX7431873.1 VWA domain-containing protein [Mycolicibacterium xanthum]